MSSPKARGRKRSRRERGSGSGSSLLGVRVMARYSNYGRFCGHVMSVRSPDPTSDEKGLMCQVKFETGVEEVLSDTKLLRRVVNRKGGGAGRRVIRRGSELDAPILFSLALFLRAGSSEDEEGYRFYRDSAVGLVSALKEEFPRSTFLIHVCSRVPLQDVELLHLAARGDMQCRRYAIGSKRGGHWALCALRFACLWEHGGPETVVVADVHDEPELVISQVYKLVHRLALSRKRIALTYWESDEAECMNKVSLPNPPDKRHCTGHFHTDGGLCVWMSGQQRRSMEHRIGDFYALVESVCRGIGCIPHGADEVLLDTFLHLTGIAKDALLVPHVHRIRDRDARVEKVEALRHVQLSRAPRLAHLHVKNVILRMGGWAPASMYVCSEAEAHNLTKKRLREAEIAGVGCLSSRVSRSGNDGCSSISTSTNASSSSIRLFPSRHKQSLQTQTYRYYDNGGMKPKREQTQARFCREWLDVQVLEVSSSGKTKVRWIEESKLAQHDVISFVETVRRIHSGGRREEFTPPRRTRRSEPMWRCTACRGKHRAHTRDGGCRLNATKLTLPSGQKNTIINQSLPLLHEMPLDGVLSGKDSPDKGSSGDGVFEVQSLVDCRVAENGKMQYLVKWKGYPDSDNSWEDDKSLSCPALLAEFKQNRDRKERFSPVDKAVSRG